MRGKRNLFKIDDRFDKLVIQEVWSMMRTRLNAKNSKETICKCKCDCGNVVTFPTRYLGNRHKKSCGCILNPKNDKHPSWKGFGEISGSNWKDIQRGAISRGRVIPFDISIEQAWNLFMEQDRKCALSGTEIKFSTWSKRYAKKHGDECTASLDRIDSSKGYTLDNVQWVHKDVNLMKMNLPQDVFIKWCRAIAARSEVNG